MKTILEGKAGEFLQLNKLTIFDIINSEKKINTNRVFVEVTFIKRDENGKVISKDGEVQIETISDYIIEIKVGLQDESR